MPLTDPPEAEADKKLLVSALGSISYEVATEEERGGREAAQ